MSDQPKTWREMTDAEKGALLLAHHEGKTIQAFYFAEWSTTKRPKWQSLSAYRVKPEPVVVVRSIPIASDCWAYDPDCHDEPAYTITFKLIDGKPDFSSVEMGEVE